jgi:SAM-dependent methyltransferase
MWYQKILADLNPTGKTLELGAGSGNFKEFKPDAISSDIENCEWLDLCFDAHTMPFGNSEISNIVMIDVLHHLSNPVGFFDEAYRVLGPGGKIMVLEPFPSLLSLLVYRMFHPEPFEFNVDYFSMTETRQKDPWESNQAVSYLLFFRDRNLFRDRFRDKLRIRKRERLSFVLYPLSGGFEHRSMVPDAMIPFLGWIEKLMVPLGALMSFRCYMVLEKEA